MVYTPYIRASSDLGFSLKWVYSYGKIDSKNIISESDNVLTMNRLSWLKKKNEPEAPDASPELKIWLLFLLGSSDLKIDW